MRIYFGIEYLKEQKKQYRDKVKSPGEPGKSKYCVIGCNARFNKFNKSIHKELHKKDI